MSKRRKRPRPAYLDLTPEERDRRAREQNRERALSTIDGAIGEVEGRAILAVLSASQTPVDFTDGGEGPRTKAHMKNGAALQRGFARRRILDFVISRLPAHSVDPGWSCWDQAERLLADAFEG